ncbi:MAG: histidine kinase [Ginsengibacter sp.]
MQNSSILSNKSIRIFFEAWWVIWIFLQFYILNELQIDSKYALIDSIIGTTGLAIICLFISNNMKYYLPRREKYWYILVISFVGTSLWLLAHRGIFALILNDDDAYMQMIRYTFRIRFVSGFLLISSMSLFSLLWYSQREQNEIDARKTEIERLNKEAELFNLRQQLQPHFLFNSLNSISSLTVSDPERARKMIHQLSDFLRGTLKKNEEQWNTLEEELLHLELYLEIEKVRFGNRLQTNIECSKEVKQMQLPSLLLQPVVENAIKFGLYDTIGEVVISIKADALPKYLKIVVQNPYDPETSFPEKGAGFGLSSIQRKLFLLFARNDLLKTTNNEQIFTTTILIPQIV